MTQDAPLSLAPTRIDLSVDARQTVVIILQNLLTDAMDLRLCIKQAHWTVRGPTFHMLHTLFDSFIAPLDDGIDDIAERAATLGAVPDGLGATVVRNSRLAPYPVEAFAPDMHLNALGDRFATLAKQMRADITDVEKASDTASAELLTGFLRQVDKCIWQLEAHTKPII